MNKFYHVSVGECVSQVYEIENVKNWDEAKKVAFADMDNGDFLAECPPEAVKEEANYPDYHFIDEDMCVNYAQLCKGVWATREPSGEEYWEDYAWYFTDTPDTYLSKDGSEFTDWERDGKDDFEEMIRDWQADSAPEYDNLEIEEAEYNEDNGRWEATASDEKTIYSLTDDGTGNIVLNYIGTR